MVRWAASANGIVVHAYSNFILDWRESGPRGGGGPGSVGAAELLGSSHGDCAETVGRFTRVAGGNIVRANLLSNFPGQGVGSVATDGLSKREGDASVNAALVLTLRTTQVNVGGVVLRTVNRQRDRLRTAGGLGQRNGAVGAVVGGDGSNRQPLVLHLVDHGAVVFSGVAHRVRVEDVCLDVVRPVRGVHERQVRVESRSFWVGFFLGSSSNGWVGSK